MLSINDYLRYSKPMMLTEIGAEGQEKIKQAKVLIIGAGGLGCPVLLYLVASGVGKIGIVDFDEIEIHNLHRQILYSEKQLELPKASTAAEILNQLNPNCSIEVFEEKINLYNADEIIEKYDIIVDGSDNFETRYIINDTCVILQKPLIYGSILKFEGQMSVFNNNGSKNLRDLFPFPPNPEDVPNCSLNGVLGTLPGIIGTMMAHETLKVIMNLSPLYNQFVLFNTLTWEFRKLNF